VRWLKPDFAGPAIIGCCLLVTCLGCCCPRPRHGLILRGDWSLELNRLPWLKGRGDAYQECSYQEVESAGSCGSSGVLPTKAQPIANRPGHSACRSSTCGVCSNSAAGTGPDSSAVLTGYHNHPRFHSVPTQPVFLPRPDRVSMIEAGTAPELHRAPIPEGAEQPPIHPTPPAPEPEVIPAPPAGSSQGWKSRGAQRQAAIEGGPDWIFRSAVNHRRDSMTPAQQPAESASGPTVTR